MVFRPSAWEWQAWVPQLGAVSHQIFLVGRVPLLKYTLFPAMVVVGKLESFLLIVV